MDNRESSGWHYTKNILVALGVMVLFVGAISIIFQLVTTFANPPYRFSVAILAYVGFIYVFGRWVLGLKARSLKTAKVKQKN